MVCSPWRRACSSPPGLACRPKAEVAQSSGNVLDPDSRVVVNAVVIVRNEATNEIRTTATDAAGHFSVTGLTAGSLRDRSRGSGFRNRPPAAASRPHVGAPEDLVDQAERGQHQRDGHRVDGAAGGGRRRAVAGIADGPVGAVADQQRIHPQLHVAVLRLQPGAADGAGHVQRQRERTGPERHEDVLPRLQGRPIQHDVRRHSVQRHQRSDPSLVGVLPGADDRLDGIRSQSRFGGLDRAIHLRRVSEHAVAVAADGARSSTARRRTAPSTRACSTWSSIRAGSAAAANRAC